MPRLTPKDMGFFMPGEFAHHTRCWMQWPCREETFGSEEALQAARRAYALVAAAISQFEPVVMAVRPPDAAMAQTMLVPSVETWQIPLDDSWARDSGPTFLIDGKGCLAGVDWGFNAWGMKSLDFAHDARVAQRMLHKSGAQRFVGPQILEGGAIHSDGQGTVLVTEQCLLHPNRNPHLSKADIEDNLREYLGASVIIWLENGLENDETDGHVDDIACFAAPGKVLLVQPSTEADPDTQTMRRNRAILDSQPDAQGRVMEIIALPHPAPRYDRQRGRLTLSYANFYMANGGIVAPAYDDPMDVEAEQILTATFPDRRVVMVPSLAIVQGGGTIHCITQQEPSP